MKIAIVENEKLQVDLLKSFLSRYEEEKKTICQADVFYNGVDFLSDYTEEYDVVFLDIQMPMMNGMEVAEKLREKDRNVAIVFVTNMAQYAIQGYRVEALDFLVKPVGYFEVSLELDKVKKRMENRKEDYLFISSHGSSIRRIAHSEIRFVEVVKHDICLHVKDEVIMYRGTIKDLLPKLNPSLFSQTDQCYIVNMNYIESVSGFEIYLETGENLHISRARKKSFLNDYTVFLNRGGFRK